MLVAVTDEKQADELRAQAQRCRRFAASIGDEETAAVLTHLAEEYEQQADRLRPDDS